ncbi:TPA: hypothetical protein KNT04_002558 [Clostridioides difficile]|nr:hypothetical protein [Clostridioides difficile]
MSIALITTKNFEVNIVEKYEDIKDVNPSENIECLIFHSSKGSQLEILSTLIKIEKFINKIIYISTNIDNISLFECVFRCIDADIYNSEEYLSNNNIVQYIVDNYHKTDMTVSRHDKDILLLENCIKEGISSKNSLLAEVTSDALINIISKLNQYDEISKNIIDIVTEMNKLIVEFENNNTKTQKEIESLNKSIKKFENTDRPNVAFMYSTYKIINFSVSKVFYIKSWAYCNYLHSFISNYQRYLKIKKGCNAKILLILPKLSLYMKRYSYKKIPILTPDNINLIELTEDAYITFEPKKLVLETFLNEKLDMHIIIDDLYGDKLIEGYNVEEFNAICNENDIKTFDLNKNRIISSISGDKDHIIIPHILSYIKESEYGKRNLYFHNCSEVYQRLDNILLSTD